MSRASTYWALVRLDKKRMKLQAEEERLIRNSLSPMDRQRRDVGLPPLGDKYSGGGNDGNLAAMTESQSTSARTNELERRAFGNEIPGDFPGVVTGKWVGIGSRGEGLVSYMGKTYKTKRIGFASIPKDAPVGLTYADGVYYSQY